MNPRLLAAAVLLALLCASLWAAPDVLALAAGGAW